MLNTTPLTALAQGQTGKVATLTATGSMRRRLQDIGLIEGTQVSCVLQAPSGDPTAYAIRGAVIALRRGDAAHVLLAGV
ncbi:MULTISPECIES: FeoA family protein [Caproicibacterium]|jgi:ferrous iron transport protein A|uniref:Ferrous iron transport protein A n=1 Tax=Caproicibacterium lactatifermentans TaxID=2666138 RepID=A0ABX6PY34_9FIRM|nr:FeoA family protein [Caproicibacterium lactatifermentans]ARP50421.1 ferrous iron transport protein A [Ruminococcaceae bacterium CPB6]QKO31072.1 ferrous iron transport protein A [Caproicibacterium lactatifermentans]